MFCQSWSDACASPRRLCRKHMKIGHLKLNRCGSILFCSVFHVKFGMFWDMTAADSILTCANCCYLLYCTGCTILIPRPVERSKNGILQSWLHFYLGEPGGL